MKPFHLLLLPALLPFTIAFQLQASLGGMDNTLSNSEREQSSELVVENVAQPSQTQADDDDDNAPMVYYTPKDYRASALKQRPILEAEGKEVILMSEFPSHIPRQADESLADYTKRYSDTMNDMIHRGVHILNDECIGDMQANGFSIGGREFDLGTKTGATKKEYREFGEWFDSVADEEEEKVEVPERFLKFEVERSETDDEDDDE